MFADIHDCGNCDACRLWKKIIREKKFPMAAYEFVSDVVSTIGRLKADSVGTHRKALLKEMGEAPPAPDVTADDIVNGVGVLAMSRYSLLRLPVFQSWNLKDSRDVGIIMRDLCEVGTLKPSPGDRFERFDEIQTNFLETFRRETGAIVAGQQGDAR